MKKRSAGNILIDLTSLLDVIFIVLLIVTCRLQTVEEAVTEKEVQAQERIDEARSEQELYKEQMESLSNISEYVVVISVNANYDEDLITRHIRVLDSGSGTGVQEIGTLVGQNTEEGLEKLRSYLQSTVEKNPDKTVVISLNEKDEDILYRDENSINKIIDEIVTSDPEHVKRRN